MPSFLQDLCSEAVNLEASEQSAYEPPHQSSHEKTSVHSSNTTRTFMNGSSVDGSGASVNKHIDEAISNGTTFPNPSLHSLANGRSSGSTYSRERPQSGDGSSFSGANGSAGTGEEGGRTLGPINGQSKLGVLDLRHPLAFPSQSTRQTSKDRGLDIVPRTSAESPQHGRNHAASAPQRRRLRSASASSFQRPVITPVTDRESSKDDSSNRYSTPTNNLAPNSTPGGSSTTSVHPGPVRLQHRHTLEVPKLSAKNRGTRDFSWSNTNASEDVITNSGRFSPTTPGARRGSLNLARRTTRSIHSDMHLDEIPQDGDVARWTETIRQKRASRRKRKEEEEDDRVTVGTKVDMHHVNWVTAYNMLTGIRFTVSRTNAKIDRELTDQDFDARHKFSFDITGNELTPSARYDFKFKDYAPWVFRHLRAKFKLDPGDYLMSLTSKYILSELGSPGKSGSFFYFSRDYKYIIKTIHHAEHKLLRKILREYYSHVERNPNTLISQFYGLHRVKIPYGRKIHFVVMNNLFPPHRDIHQTFDLKGSTIGREFKEEYLEHNPRATLKDLNWLRRNYHLEFGPSKKFLFIEQMRRDVALLQKLKIMDYSLLVGIHDLGKGNEENLRDRTLRVFQPGAERGEEPQPSMLTRTPSKLENARKARELRQIIKLERPVPIDKSTSKMPDEMLEERAHFLFYSDDGGFRATHDDGQPGEKIYYLGIIDCLTHYGFIKKAEHFWKGMSQDKTQISPIAPEAYGDRFIKFITGITMSKEAAENEKRSNDLMDGSVHTNRQSNHQVSRDSEEAVIARAEKEARRTEERGASEDSIPDRTLSTARSTSAEHTGSTLAIVEEAGEVSSTGGRSARSHERESRYQTSSQSGLLPGSVYHPPLGGRPPPTPPKDLPPVEKLLPLSPPLMESPTPLRPIDG